MSDLPDVLKIKCPRCGRGLHPLPLMRHATHVADRSCRRCGRRWRVVAKPRHITGPGGLGEGVITFTTWNEL